jgi:sulfate adenylyltransferase
VARAKDATLIISSYSVRDTLRLAPVNGQRQGSLFAMPINLDVSQKDIDVLGLAPGVRVALRDPRDEAALAILTSESRSYMSL